MIEGWAVGSLNPRRLVRGAWLTGCAFLMTAGAQAQPYYRFAPSAAWVDVADAELAPRNAPRTGSAETLLFDRQINVTASGDEFYQHLVTRVLNSVGVDEYSQINLEVDPSFQTLDIHWLRIVRSGVEIDVASTARISELAQETDLRDRIYNGRYTINVLLSDVRPGDVVDYAYSLRSREQLFPGHFYARVDLAFSVPVARQRVRILSPVERKLRYRSSDGVPLPGPVTRGSSSELILESRDVPGVAADGRVPGWYSQWPFVEVSDSPGWRDVVERVRPLYTGKPHGGPLVDETVAGIRSRGGTPEEQALHALQWVQEEIRYTSISIGRGSHEPTPPNTVIERRYGDCKDKSLLLAALLRRLGVEADVALVHSWRGRALDETLPTPYAFDHAIVRARIGAAVYWFDATSSMQLGPLAIDRSPNFARALVLANATDGFEIVPKPGTDVRQRDIAVVLDARAGIEAAATLDITTRYRGELAENMRDAFSSSTPEQRQNDYVSYIEQYYPTAKVREPLSFVDDRDGNVIEIAEHYSLDTAFAANDEGVLELMLHPDELYSYADPLGAGSRQAPLAVEYPIHVRQSIVMRLPEPWPVTEGTVAVDNPVFQYRGSVRYARNTLTLTYDYRALDDHVPASAVARYETDRARMNDDLGYLLSYNPALEGGIPSAVALLPMITLLLALGGSIWAAIKVGLCYDPEPGSTDADAPVGIRGWLLLPAFGAIVAPIVTGAVVAAWLPLIGAAQWEALPTIVSEPYASTARAAVLATLAASSVIFVMSVLSLWLFMTKRTSATVVYIALMWVSTGVFTLIVLWTMAAGFDPEAQVAEVAGSLVRDVFGATLWTAYMLNSRRVRATFVRRYRNTPITAE